MADYKGFLAAAKREKPYEALEHDMTLLDCVRRLRSKAKSSLDAQALCITTDFHLWRFDRDQSRRLGTLPTMILPNQLLQLLRPFVSITPDFDRSFADAFAIPEFRAIGKGGQAAIGRLLEIIAAHGNISERTASALLANDLLLDGLGAKKDTEIYQFVESAIAAENDVLAREREELAEELRKERAARGDFESATKSEMETRLARSLAAKETEAQESQRRVEERTASQLAEERQLRQEAERRAHDASERAEAAGKKSASIQEELNAVARARAEASAASRDRNRAIAAVAVGVTVFALSEWLWRVTQFDWLMNHPNTYGVRGCVLFASIAISLAAFRKDWRKNALLVLVVPVAIALLQILGGPGPRDTAPPVSPSPQGPAGPPKP